MSDDVDTLIHLGLAHFKQNNINEALKCLNKAVLLSPDCVEATFNLGIIFQHLNNFEQAIEMFLRTVQINPNHMESFTQLGLILKSQGRFEDAKKCYVRILNHYPDNQQTLFDMAYACQHLNQENDALIWYEKLLARDTNHAQALINVGHIYRIHGNIQQAEKHFLHASSKITHSGPEILHQFSLPVIYQSKDEILFYRNRLLNFIKNKTVQLNNPFKEVGITLFWLAYHGLNDTQIQKNIANFYYKACPSLNYCSPYLNKPVSHEKIKIAFVTSYLLDAHPIGKVNHGLLKFLNRERFDVTIFHPSGERPVHSQIHEEFRDSLIYLKRDLSACRERIASEKPDIIFFPEIGMDPFIYFLAFSRLARVQCVGWGHPVTTGIKNVDYYLSSRDMEPENGGEHYSEQLLALNTFISYFFRPKKKISLLKRSSFELPEKGHWYVCPQNIQKFHPDMDVIFSEILKNDPNAWLILFKGKYPSLTQQLINRFSKNIPKLKQRIIFIKPMPFETFLQFLLLSDVVLDIPSFSSGTTTLEALSVGVPVVTLPGDYMRQRLAYGCLKRINVLDTVAKNVSHYISLSRQLACDKNFKKYVQSKILAQNDILFENPEVINAHEQFFQWAAEQNYSEVP
ncbi:TPR repeat-containing protein [Candidatus Magnetomorum sp. HK-1]|nr:TPR repeat-containing protein [Candidatus Magnetomorum sp. HK-1]